ncbi:MAG TPA: LPS assembly protein LptD [Acidobacteriaceae bacterium]|nr:LPS assembly protein LptD [Acidobacteriaceae bacterium]
MRTRVCICTMLLAFCHVRMEAQALTMRLPPFISGTQRAVVSTPKSQPTSSDSSEDSSSSSSSSSAVLPDAPQAALDNLPIAVPIPAPPTGVPVTIRARQQERQDDTYNLRGEVEIDYEDYVILADHVQYNSATGDVKADGHLQVTGGPDHEDFAADHGTLNLNLQTGHFYDVIGSVGVLHSAAAGNAFVPELFGLGPTSNRSLYTSTNPFLITAKELIKKGPDSYELVGGSMTSCRLPKPDWRIFAPHIVVANGTAKAANANFRAMGYPILYLPYVTHGIDTASRQSGFLIPALEVGSTIKGTVIGEEYYWVIGRTADLLVGFQYYSLRGWEQNAEFRYKGMGKTFVHGLYNGLEDRGLAPQYVNQGGQDTIVTARHDMTPYTRAIINAEYLSSYLYRLVFAENYSLAVASEVKSWAFLAHEKNGFASSFEIDRYEKYASTVSGDEVHIFHLPRLEFDTADRGLGRSGGLAGGEASFGILARSEPYYRSHHVARLDLFPHVSLPWIADGWTFRPTLGLRETAYSHSQLLGPVPSTATPQPTAALPGEDAVPTAKDAGINRAAMEADLQILPPVLERDFDGPYLANHFGVTLRHTIEPEVNYRYVAGIHNFNRIPRFDATDIYSDTDEVEYGVTQRLFLKRLHPAPCDKDLLQAEPQPSENRTCGEGSRQLFSWFVGQKYFADPSFGNAVIAGRRNVFTSTLDFSGIDYLTEARDLSPVVSRLRIDPSFTTNLEWDADYDTKTGRWAASDVYADYHRGNFFSGLGHSLLNAVGETPMPPGQPPNVVNYNQMQLLLGYGAITKPGFSAAAKTNFQLEGRALEYGGLQVTYNRNCCGLTVEVQRFALGAVRNETSTTFNLTLSGVAAVGSLVRAERLF